MIFFVHVVTIARPLSSRMYQKNHILVHHHTIHLPHFARAHSSPSSAPPVTTSPSHLPTTSPPTKNHPSILIITIINKPTNPSSPPCSPVTPTPQKRHKKCLSPSSFPLSPYRNPNPLQATHSPTHRCQKTRHTARYIQTNRAENIPRLVFSFRPRITCCVYLVPPARIVPAVGCGIRRCSPLSRNPLLLTLTVE